MSKDRAAPFSRKHRKYWIPVTGGMLLIGTINLGIGFWSYDDPPPEPEKIELVIPRSQYARDGGIDTAPIDASATVPPTTVLPSTVPPSTVPPSTVPPTTVPPTIVPPSLTPR